MSKKSNVTIADITRVNDKLIEKSVAKSSASWVARDCSTGRFSEVKVSYDTARGESIWKKIIEPYVTKKS
jgi:hypothetical protein